MKYSDVEKLRELGLISDEQRQAIVERLQLREEGTNKLLIILSTIGALLVVAGIVLLIAANWEGIPRGAKVAAALALMLGAWWGGWLLRECPGRHPRIGEALYLIGAGMWLANIVLIGQIYNLSSRPSNAFLLWLAGIAVLPWVLRIKSLFVLSLAAFGVWLGVMLNERKSWIQADAVESQFVCYGLCGLALIGWGFRMRGTRWGDFASPAEKTGLLTLLFSAYPMSFEFRHFGVATDIVDPVLVLLLGLSGLACVLAVLGFRRLERELTPQWRWLWGGTLAGIVAMQWAWLLISRTDPYGYGLHLQWIFPLGLAVASFIQVQVGILLRSAFTVNFAVVYLALLILAIYIRLFGSMATTGGMFLASGLFLIGFGYYLERKRRDFIARLRTQPTANS